MSEDPILSAEDVNRMLALIGWGGDPDDTERIAASHEALRRRYTGALDALRATRSHTGSLRFAAPETWGYWLEQIDSVVADALAHADDDE